MYYYKSIQQILNKYNLKRNFPINDIQAWNEMKNYNFVYNKLRLSEYQNLYCAPIGLYPSIYPIVFKPIINLYGMSKGFHIIYNKEEYDKYQKDGFFWMEYLSGLHLCIDVIVLKGKIKYFFYLNFRIL